MSDQNNESLTGATPPARQKKWLNFVRSSLIIILKMLGFAACVVILLQMMDPLFKTLSGVSDSDKPGMQEWQWARADHEIIATTVAACSKVFDLSILPPHIRAQLRLDTAPDGHTAGYSTSSQKEPANFSLSNFQRTVIYLSDTISHSRYETATSASVNYSRMFWFQLTIVAIGAMTTILISIKSISNSDQTSSYGRWFFWIGIAAIVFSSVGTAASALNSFYGPRESYLRV